jgi:hypothetical protein
MRTGTRAAVPSAEKRLFESWNDASEFRHLYVSFHGSKSARSIVWRASAPNCALASTNPLPRSPRRVPNAKWPRIRFASESRYVLASARLHAVNFNSMASLRIVISQIDVAKNEISAAELQASRAQQNLTAKSLEFERLQVCCECNRFVQCCRRFSFHSFYCFVCAARAQRGPLTRGQARAARL